MGGGLMQLVAYGAQDIYLTGNPQITFFKVVYRRHTNFACEAIEQTFNGTASFGSKVVCTISRNGDLVSNMYLEVDLLNGDPLNGSVRNGHKLIKSAEIEIGGQRIDKHYGEWLDIWTQLSSSSETLEKKNLMLSGNLKSSEGNNVKKLYIPLQFWFNRNPGLALPLIALQYHEVKISIEFNKLTDINSSNLRGVKNGLDIQGENKCELSNLALFCDYIFLDTDERRRFAQVSHEYLIEQVQTIGTSSYSGNRATINLDLNHPVKELIWVVQNSGSKGTFDYTAGIDLDLANIDANNYMKEHIHSAKIQLNGQDRFRQRNGSYFRVVQPYQHHTGGNRQALSNREDTKEIINEKLSKEFGYINCYSFALRPEEHQPSGTCNFSRIDNAVLDMVFNTPNGNNTPNNINIKDGQNNTVLNPLGQFENQFNVIEDNNKDVRVYAINYNVLRIMSGMGGLAYSN
jgi:hypothetical protein